MMVANVSDGAADGARIDGVDVAGKTGTAEKISRHGGYNQNAVLSSFLGVFPIENPRYEVLVLIDEPRGTADTHGFATGGWTAAPVVGRTIAQMGPLYGIMPDLAPDHDIVKDMAMYLKDIKEGKSIAALGTDH